MIALGLLLIPFVYFFDTQVINQALMSTGGVTGLMILMGVTYPKLFLGVGRTLIFVLSIVCLVEWSMYLLEETTSDIVDLIMLVIFSSYIGYNWARAQRVPKTFDNAIDCATALYMDIIILFMRFVFHWTKE